LVDRVPPEDPEQWTDEEWLAWLDETDGQGESGPPPGEPVQPARDRLPTGGRLLYASMHGLHEVIYGQVDEPAIVIEASGDSDDPESLEVHLDTEHPEDSTVTVRPWLLPGDEEPAGP
jgi:hypothetical protein